MVFVSSRLASTANSRAALTMGPVPFSFRWSFVFVLAATLQNEEAAKEAPAEAYGS